MVKIFLLHHTHITPGIYVIYYAGLDVACDRKDESTEKVESW